MGTVQRLFRRYVLMDDLGNVCDVGCSLPLLVQHLLLLDVLVLDWRRRRCVDGGDGGRAERWRAQPGAGAGALRGLRSPRGRAGPSVYGIGCRRRSKIQRIPPLDDGVSPAPLAAAGTTRQCNVVWHAAGRRHANDAGARWAGRPETAWQRVPCRVVPLQISE